MKIFRNKCGQVHTKFNQEDTSLLDDYNKVNPMDRWETS